MGTGAGDSRAILDVADLGIRFGRTVVLRGLTFSVGGGATLAVIGPNGSGKTVLLRALIGAIPFDGTIRWTPGVRIGYVPQKLDIARDAPLTSADLLRAKAAVTGAHTNDFAAMLGEVGLAPATGNDPIGTLSGGQFQRLLLAVALIGRPSVLLLDEPTAGIDEPGQERLHELLDTLQRERGLTVVLISHDLSVVYRHATAVLCLARDRYWFGAPKEILTPDRLRDVYGAPIAFHVHES